MVDSKRSQFSDYVGTQQKIDYIEGRETAEKIWSRTWLPALYDDTKRRMLTVGDAVTEGMSFYYEELMGSDWSVHRQTGSVPVCSPLYKDRIRFALTAARKQYEVICFTPAVLGDETPAEFDKAVREAVAIIKELQPEARLVIVAKTMSDPAVVGKDANLRTYGYNRALEVLAADENAEFVDLGVFSERLTGDRAENGVLFTDAGYKKFVFEVVKKIK